MPVGTAFSLVDYPALWPVLILPAFLAWWGVSTRRPGEARLRTEVPDWLLPAGGVLCLALYVWSVANYLCGIQFVDFYEPREASVAWVLMRGGAVYTGSLTEERYSGPYGPVLYIVLGLSQSLLGPSTFSTKLPCALAGLASVGIFWSIARRLGATRRQACVLAGAEAAMLLALRYASYWAKPDPLILLAVTAGIHCALRRGPVWEVAFGVCAGLAIDLKLHALAYFLPTVVVAWHTGWPPGALTRAGGAAAVTALLPFALDPGQFSLANYLEFLRVTSHEGFGSTAAFGFCRWAALLTALVLVGDRFFRPRDPSGSRNRSLRRAYRTALGVGVGLVAVPGCAVGAGQGHLLPFLPLFLLAPGDGFAGAAFGMRVARPGGLFWRACAGAASTACLLVAVQTGWRTYVLRTASAHEARACRAELRRFVADHRDWTILAGSGDGVDDLATDFRHEAVFAGQPVGLDAAAIMDYQRGGEPEPDIPGLVRELQARDGRPVVWIVPKGDAPFTEPNIYDRRPAHSEAFRRAFHAGYERSGPAGQFFDLYRSRTGGPPATRPAQRAIP